MARIVVLSFDDNDAAEQFTTALLEAQSDNWRHRTTRPNTVGIVASAYATVEAVIARPTVSCRCRIVGMTEWARLNNQRKKTRGMGKFQDGPQREEYVASIGQWHKTERFGWLIHTKCKRPNYYVVHRFIQNMLIGIGCNNLLNEIKERRNANTEPEGATDGTSITIASPDQLVPNAPLDGPVLQAEVPSEHGD
jgi:hypothetical protein